LIRTSTHKRSKLQERRAASSYGGAVNPGSGNQWHHKADVRTPEYLVECKTTTKLSYSLTEKTIKTLWDQAILDNRIPVLEIELPSLTAVILDKNDFIAMKEELEQLRVAYGAPT
jgi:hypothetical protein